MITAQSVSKNFGDIAALREVSFKITPGEFVFLTGPSGAGKTTLFRLIMREIHPDSGMLDIDGQDLGKLKPSRLPAYRRQVGVVWQDLRLLGDLRVSENVALPLEIRQAKKSDLRIGVEQALAMVGLSARAELFPAQLSGGELQRVGLARAIVAKPKLILADEPTGNLDPKTSKEIVTLIKKLQEELKTTVIMATHNVDIVNAFAQRVIKLDDGWVVKDVPKGKYND